MKISKNRLKAIIMQEVKNIMETGKKDSGSSRDDQSADHKDYAHAKQTKKARKDRAEDSHKKGQSAGDQSADHPDYKKKAKNRKDSVKEDYDYTEEKHDDMDEDHLERIRDDINRHIDALRDQHRRVKDYEDRKDD